MVGFRVCNIDIICDSHSVGLFVSGGNFLLEEKMRIEWEEEENG